MRIVYSTTALFIMVMFVIIQPISAKDSVVRPDPEIATGNYSNKVANSKNFMIVTANPHATKAGYAVLKRGGSAVDAMIAAQLVLGLVEPQSSGLGGGAFVLYYDAATKKLSSFDGRETSPALAGPYLFQKGGAPMEFMEAVLGGRSVGVPGTPMLMSALHEKYGKLTWMELFEDATHLAEEGFEMSDRLAVMLAFSSNELKNMPGSRDYFFDADGKPLRAGTVLKNPAYAKTLKDMAFYNVADFYTGDLAKQIVDTVQNIEGNPGLMRLQDLQVYKVIEREPVCGPYRAYIVCSMGEPSSGGLTLLQALGMLEKFNLSGAKNPLSWHLITEASRLAFADRNHYMADPDFVNTPGIQLLNPDYISQRAALIDFSKPLETVKPGVPPDWDGPLYPETPAGDRPGTSHISIIDADGNVLSMTTTIEGAFGSHVMVGGFLLNNELTDFSFVPADEHGHQVANRVEGGKRPRSSMSPTIVFDHSGAPVLVLGSAGGSNIIGYVLQRIIAVLDWNMSLEDALAMPSILAKSDQIRAEIGTDIRFISDKVAYSIMNSGLTAIQVKDGKLIGAADPRREGMGMGD